MADAMLDVLWKNLEQLESSSRWLGRSYEKCRAIGIKEAYTEDEFDTYENLTARYARTVDLIINRVLRSVDAAEFLEPGSVIDAANRAEKRGIIESVSRMRDLKDLRNEIAHEYETDDLQGLFGSVMTLVPEVLALASRIADYCIRFRT